MLRSIAMPPLRHILFPYDFSTQGRQIAAYVRALAARCGARVTLYSDVPPVFDSVPAAMGGHLLHAGDDAAEWKRRQYPPGPKISFKAFGKDRRLPITNRWRESGDAG